MYSAGEILVIFIAALVVLLFIRPVVEVVRKR